MQERLSAYHRGMNLFISHTTALRYWLLSDPNAYAGRSWVARRSVPVAVGSAPKVTGCEAADICDAYGLKVPFHVSVADVNDKRKSPYFVSHVTGSLPCGSDYLRISNGLYVASPELALLQSGTMLADEALILAAFELCSTYRRGFRDRKTEYNCSQLTTVEKIGALLQKCRDGSGRSARGCKRLGKVLGYMRDGSASPQETRLALLLGLPYRMGGENLGVPMLNYRVDLDKEARRLAGRSYCKGDLCWPKWNLDLEFESYEFHEGREALISDSARREALNRMGMTVMTITYEQVKNREDVELLASVVRQHVGMRSRLRENYLEQRLNLYRMLESDDLPE